MSMSMSMSMSEPSALRPRDPRRYAAARFRPGAVYPYAPMGAPAISLESIPMSGALALKLALKMLDGDKDVPKETVIPLQIVTTLRLARLWQADGRARHASELLAQVYGWLTQGFDNPVLRDAKALLHELTDTVDSAAISN